MIKHPFQPGSGPLPDSDPEACDVCGEREEHSNHNVPDPSLEPDYTALGQTEEEARLLAKHDKGETLHAYEGPLLPSSEGDAPACLTCGDTPDGLMHNNTWRNVEPLLEAQGDHARRFPIEVGTSPEPWPDTLDHEAETDPETATHWTLHLRTTEPTKLASVVDHSGMQGLTGYLLGGDSFGAWAEVPAVEDDRALHVYFDAPGQDAAWPLALDIVGRFLGNPTEHATDWALSTAVDWAVQVDHFEHVDTRSQPDPMQAFLKKVAIYKVTEEMSEDDQDEARGTALSDLDTLVTEARLLLSDEYDVGEGDTVTLPDGSEAVIEQVDHDDRGDFFTYHRDGQGFFNYFDILAHQAENDRYLA